MGESYPTFIMLSLKLFRTFVSDENASQKTRTISNIQRPNTSHNHTAVNKKPQVILSRFSKECSLLCDKPGQVGPGSGATEHDHVSST